MSKPNLLGFASSVGIYRNKRIRDLRCEISKKVQRKVSFCELAPMLFQVVMAYAAENQTNGDFSGYSIDRWSEIFEANHVHLERGEVAAVVKAFHDVELFDGEKIRSWMKFNRHLADYDGIVRAKAKAAKAMHKKREQEAKAALKNSENSAQGPHENTAESVQKTAPEKDSPSRRLWLLEHALQTATGKAKKDLLAQKRQLLSSSLGVDLSEPSPAPAKPSAPARPAPKVSEADMERTLLASASQLLQEAPELLTDRMVEALHRAGKRLPDHVAGKFSKLLKRLGEEAGDNPVPG